MEQRAPAPLFSTYLGQQLTPENLPVLAPQMPNDDCAKVRTWISSVRPILHELMKLERPLLKMPFVNPDLSQCGYFSPQIINRVLKREQHLRNMSTNNYIFDVPGTNYVAQIAGRENRVTNLLAANDPDQEELTLTDAPQAMWDRVITKWPHTYQTVSRLAVYLRAKEAIERFNLDKIKIPRTYLVGLNGNLPREATDDNSIVIQEKRPNAKPVIKLAPNEYRSITPEAVRQLAIVTIYAALWDMYWDNVLFDVSTGLFVISDFEQPKISNPCYFFLKRDADALKQIFFGLENIDNLFNCMLHLSQIRTKITQLDTHDFQLIAAGTLPASIATPL